MADQNLASTQKHLQDVKLGIVQRFVTSAPPLYSHYRAKMFILCEPFGAEFPYVKNGPAEVKRPEGNL
jgi:hypothetical protein